MNYFKARNNIVQQTVVFKDLLTFLMQPSWNYMMMLRPPRNTVVDPAVISIAIASHIP